MAYCPGCRAERGPFLDHAEAENDEYHRAAVECLKRLRSMKALGLRSTGPLPEGGLPRLVPNPTPSAGQTSEIPGGWRPNPGGENEEGR